MDELDEYLDRNPEGSWARAYEMSAEAAHQKAADDLGDMIDYMNESLGDR